MTEPDPGPGSPAPQLDDGRFRAGLDAMFDEVAIGEAIRGTDGAIVDFRMVYLNATTRDGAGRSSADLVGRTVLECFPGWGESGLFDAFTAVVETGEPFVGDRIAYSGLTPEGEAIDGHWSLSVARFGDGYIAASRDVTALVADEEARRAVEREAERNRTAVELLHRAALPARLPAVDGVEIAARYESARSAQPLGGDWYDAFELGDGRLGLVIADVSGHGLEAAAFMVQVRNVVRALAFEHDEPDVVLAQANRVLERMDEQSLFATCCFGVLAPAAGTSSWASAGHFVPLLVRGDATVLAVPVGPPLGVQPDARYSSATAPVDVGDLLVLFTDGLVEDRTRSIDDGLARLARTAGSNPGASAHEVADALVAAATDRSDDLALLCVRLV